MNSNTLHPINIPRAICYKRSDLFSFIIRIAVGMLFTITGLSKLLTLASFSGTISHFLSLSAIPATIMALFIIITETLCGMCLLFNKLTRPAIILLAILTTVFLYVLTIAIVGHRTFICHCFGVLPFSLSNSSELIFNFIILDLLILLYSITMQPADDKLKTKKWVIAVWIILLLYGEASAAAFIIDRDITDNPINITQINNYITSQEHKLNGISRFRHIVLLRLSDFNCPPCFNDFVGFSETLSQYYDPLRDASRCVGLVVQSETIIDTTTLHAWGRANNIVFPLVLVPDSIFQRFNFTKSCIVNQQPHGRLLFVYTFPGSESQRKMLLSALME